MVETLEVTGIEAELSEIEGRRDGLLDARAAISAELQKAHASLAQGNTDLLPAIGEAQAKVNALDNAIGALEDQLEAKSRAMADAEDERAREEQWANLCHLADEFESHENAARDAFDQACASFAKATDAIDRTGAEMRTAFNEFRSAALAFNPDAVAGFSDRSRNRSVEFRRQFEQRRGAGVSNSLLGADTVGSAAGLLRLAIARPVKSGCYDEVAIYEAWIRHVERRQVLG